MCIPMSKWLEIFLASMYTQIKSPHKILSFFVNFIIIIFFSVLNETKEAQLHVGHTRILHPPRLKICP